MALQEVFTERDVLIDRLSETYRVIDPDTKIRGRIFGSGLLLLSAFPVEDFWVHRYTNIAAEDSLVAKSAMYARLVLPTGKLDVIVTHMQAGAEEKKAGGVRLAQLKELRDFVGCHLDPAVPRLIVGDLNIKAPMPGRPPPGKHSQYKKLLKILTDAKRRPPRDVFDELDQPTRTHPYQSVTYDYRNYPLARLGAVFCKDAKQISRLDYMLCHNSDRPLKFSGVQARRFWRKTEAGKVHGRGVEHLDRDLPAPELVQNHGQRHGGVVVGPHAALDRHDLRTGLIHEGLFPFFAATISS